ncbi:MAG: 2-dehydropantoate 2-reductase [Alcanivoracaceae bacterium]|nr:2-dehydropantoate 2-reductase [Alcanivoracaceae bacterium]
MPADIWHLIGAGSMGALAASRLLAAGFDVRVISRHGQPLQRRLLAADGSQHAVTLPAAGDEPIRRLLVAVKAGDTRLALQPLLPRLCLDAQILRLQNGMGSLDEVPLPASVRVLHLVTTDGAWRHAEDIHVVAENSTLIGDGGDTPPDWLAGLLPHWPGLRWCQDIDRAQWQKLAVNAVINPLTALYRCRNGELLDGAECEQKMAELASEVDQLLSACYPDWPMDTLQRSRDIARQTAANTSSMLADVLAGRETELRFINGYLLRQAQRLGLALPAHQSLTCQL